MRFYWYCPNDPWHRVLPGTSMENNTIAPEPGQKGGDILLRSLNSRLAGEDEPKRVGWCGSCKRWVTAVACTRQDIEALYMNRAGVRVRDEAGRVISIRSLRKLNRHARRKAS